MKALLVGIVGLMLCVPPIVVGSIRWYKMAQFDIHCGGHLKRAGDANTIEMASKELETAIQYMEVNGLTQGSEQLKENLGKSRDTSRKILPNP